MKKRETVWQSRAHRRCFGICTVCLSLYIAYTTYLSQSGFLSGGVKTLLLVRNLPNMVFNASTCGDNCARWLLKIGKEQDVFTAVFELRHA